MTPTDRRIRLAADGVVASYIHDISARTGTRPTTPARRLERTRSALRRRDEHARRVYLAGGVAAGP